MTTPYHPFSPRLPRRAAAILLALLFGLLGSTAVHGQEYLRMIRSGEYRVADIQAAAEAYFQGQDQGRGTGYKQYKRWEYNALRLMDESGYLKPQAHYLQEWERFNAERHQQLDWRGNTEEFWEELGPDYWNASTSWNPGVGRLTCFAIDPADHDHIIVGANTGGVWKTTDRGGHWAPLSDFFSNLTVYAIAMHPHDKDTYFFGSDDGKVYKSTDGGATWQALANAGNGRVNKLLVHPAHPDTLFASAQDAGFFRSHDGGQSWERRTADPTGFDLQFKPGDLNTIYASGSAFHKSTDGGETFTSTEAVFPFTVLGDTPAAGNFLVTNNAFSPGQVPIPEEPNGIQAGLVLYEDGSGYLACGPALDPAALAGKIVLVRRGDCTFASKVVRAQQAGALAVIVVNNVSGSIVMGGGDAAIAIPAVSISREAGEALIAALEGGDELEARLEIPLFTGTFADGPKMLGLTPADPERIYVLEAEGRVFGALYRSLDGGENFERLDHTGKNYFGYSTEAADDRGQAPRDMAIAVHPYRPEEVHIAGILSWRSLDGGESFQCTADWIPNAALNKGIGYCHADVDAMGFLDSTLFVATDGGLFYAEDTENIRPEYYTDLSTGLGIRQFYKIGISQTDPVIVSGGSQDNGTSFLSAATGWIDWLGADGMETFIDKNDPNIMYGTTQYGRLYVTYDGGFSYFPLPLPGSERGNWVTPFEQDPVQPNTIYVGYEEVYKSTNGGNTWQAISQSFPEKLDHLKIAPSAPNVMYCAYADRLFRTATGQGSWEPLSGFAGRINSIAIHPQDPMRVAIATTSAGKVYVSEDGGNSWEVFRKNLPDFSALALAWHEYGLYLGMNYGIFFIDETADAWLPFNNNLPNVIINELEINYADNKLYAATYGRGLWASYLYDAAPTAARSEALAQGVRIAPNPTSGQIQAEWPAAAGLPTNLEIYDAQGRLLRYQKTLDAGAFSLDLSAFPDGFYFLRLGNALGTVTKRVSKQ